VETLVTRIPCNIYTIAKQLYTRVDKNKPDFCPQILFSRSNIKGNRNLYANSWPNFLFDKHILVFSVQNIENGAATHGKHAVSRTVFFDWHTCFREGTTSVNDKEGRGRKK